MIRCGALRGIVEAQLSETVPQRIVEFQPDNRFTGNLTSPTFINDVKQAWLELVPSTYNIHLI